jgi:hypothetical protein
MITFPCFAGRRRADGKKKPFGCSPKGLLLHGRHRIGGSVLGNARKGIKHTNMSLSLPRRPNVRGFFAFRLRRFFAFQVLDFLMDVGVFHPFFAAIGAVYGPCRTLKQKPAGFTGKYQAVSLLKT